MEFEDSARERAQLRERLASIEKQQSELWLAGLSVGGGIAIDDRRWELEDEARALKARLAELAD
ncbi:hypothetical protein [Microbacterium oxydans]|uniref:hypothetical protein n=1 Tax=Microbacterium oxydans TaxID=82380 RepID=UPI0024AD1BAB|nr:hypothetical protein [Microbacterium oxydans]